MRGSEMLPTVRVASADSPQGFIVINESDLRDHHKLFERPPWEDSETTAPPAPPDDTQIVKGGRGKFYVKRGAIFASKGFDTEGEAFEWMKSEGFPESVA